MTQEQLDFLGTFDTHQLTTYLRNERHTAFILWQTDDVIGTAKEMGFEMSQEDAEAIMPGLDNSADCEYGLTWESIRYHVNEWIEENSFEVEIKEVSADETRVTKFCSIETNENIEDFWNDDDYYFYGLSKEEVESFIGKGEMVGEAKIIKVN